MHEVMEFPGGKPSCSAASPAQNPRPSEPESSGITYSIAFVINLTGNPDELATASNTQILESFPRKRTYRIAFFTQDTPKSFFQHVSNGFEKLGF